MEKDDYMRCSALLRAKPPFLSHLLYHILFKEKWDVTALLDSHTDTRQGGEPQKSTTT